MKKCILIFLVFFIGIIIACSQEIKSGSIYILSYAKMDNYPSSLESKSICEKWILSENDIRKIVSISVAITTQEHHYYYDHLPCNFQVLLKQNGSIRSIDINAGSWYRDETNDKFYGCFIEECKHFFLSDKAE